MASVNYSDSIPITPLKPKTITVNMKGLLEGSDTTTLAIVFDNWSIVDIVVDNHLLQAAFKVDSITDDIVQPIPQCHITYTNNNVVTSIDPVI